MPAGNLLRARLSALEANRRKRTMNRQRSVIRVVSPTAGASHGLVLLHGATIPCALGRSGRRRRKREGDGATPIGTWRLCAVLYPATHRRPRTGLPAIPFDRDDGWCDEPRLAAYNQPVRLPLPASHERLWREDSLYDRVVVLDHNRSPVQPGRGSAIFLHVARDGLAPTDGCIAVARPALDRLLQRARPNLKIVIR